MTFFAKGLGVIRPFATPARSYVLRRMLSTPVIHLVNPATPTALANKPWLPLPATDRIFASADLSWVFPGPLDLERLKSSLALALRDYPHCAGRLAYDHVNQQWRILLTNDPVPITVVTTNVDIFSEDFHHDHHADFCDEVPFPDATHRGIFSSPLTKIKLTIMEHSGDTSITVTQSHVVGDGSTVTGMMHAWSSYYQGKLPSQFPTFEKYVEPEPTITPEALQYGIRYLSFLSTDFTYQEYIDRLKDMTRQTRRINLKFSSNQLQAITRLAVNDADHNITVLDSLSAYLISWIQRISDIPITRVQNIIGFRGLRTPVENGAPYYRPPPLTSVGNGFVIVSCEDKLKPSSSIGAIASMLRKTLSDLREPEAFQHVFATYCYFFDRSSRLNRMPWEWPTETSIQLNILAKLRWLEAHFGYPGRVRIYDWDSCENFLEFLPASPVQLSNRQWSSYIGGIDVSFRLKHYLVPRLLNVIEKDMQNLGSPGRTSVQKHSNL